MQTKNFAGIDYFRFIAAFLVVAIHISPFQVWNETVDFLFTYCIGRIAVPFFLMTTGYFVLAPYVLKQKKEAISKYMTKNAILYLIVTILYLPINFYSDNLPKNVPEALKDLFFDGTFYHLWYFPAAMIGCLLVLFLIKRSVLTVVIFITATYVIGLFGDSYYGLIEDNSWFSPVYDVIFSISSYTRNGIFFAPIFLLLGMLAAIPRFRTSLQICRFGFVLSLACMLIEGYFTYSMELQKHNSMYLFLIPTMYFLFQLLLSVSGNAPNWIRDVSMLIYIIHPAMIVCLRGIAKAANLTEFLVESTFLQYICVSLMSLAASYFIHFFLERGKQIVSKRQGMD